MNISHYEEVEKIIKNHNSGKEKLKFGSKNGKIFAEFQRRKRGASTNAYVTKSLSTSK